MVPDINSQQFQITLVEQEWESYAEFAYQAFCNKGRGAIYIDLNEVRISTGPSGETNFDLDRFSYVPINNKDIVGQEMHDKMLSYDPSTEVVFVFRFRTESIKRPDGFELAPTGIFVYTKEPTPKQLHDGIFRAIK